MQRTGKESEADERVLLPFRGTRVVVERERGRGRERERERERERSLSE